MATLTVYDRGEDPVFTAADAGGDTFANDGATEFLVMNTGISDVTAVAVATRACSHGFLDDWSVLVPAGSVQRIGPLLPSRFNDAAGRAGFTYSATENVVVAAQRQR